MTPKQAIALAKQSVIDIFADEGISNVTLEEVRFDEVRNHWLITVGFYRPFSPAEVQSKGGLFALPGPLNPRLDKVFKTVRIDDKTEVFQSIEHRAVEGVDA